MSQKAKVAELKETAEEKIARLERDLAAALELATDQQRGLDAAMADHSRLEAERARLAMEVGCLLDAARTQHGGQNG